MDETEAPPPHAGERLTRDDALRLIEEHGGPAGLDLEQADLENVDLSELDLHGTDLSYANLQTTNLRKANLQGADLFLANLQGARLSEANLQRADFVAANLQEAVLHKANLHGADMGEADLRRAVLISAMLSEANLKASNLQEAKLWRASLRGGNLEGANLEKADLTGADLRRARLAWANLRDANLEGADWGDYKLGEEIAGDFDQAASVYRALKQRHTQAGMYDIAGEFHYREMEARRKLAWKGDPLQEQKRRVPYALALNAFGLLYGYGERPERVIGWAAAVVFGLALVHWLFGTIAGGFLDALYFSAVSFPALGYGEWAPEPQGWAGRFLGAAESFMGVFMMALFLVTFTRKMTR